jgi:hypothetical protein
VYSLGTEELRRLRRVVDEWLSHPAGSAGPGPQEDEFKCQLVEAELLKEVRPPVQDPDAYRGRTPVPIQGKPLSETIVEERR